MVLGVLVIFVSDRSNNQLKGMGVKVLGFKDEE
jgi:hypothetical protein